MALSDQLLFKHGEAQGSPFTYLEPLPDPVLVIDPRLGVHFANKAARELFPALHKLTPGEPLPRFIRQPVPIEVAERAFAHADRGVTRAERLILPGVVEKRFEVRAVPLADAAGIDAGQAALLLFHEQTAAWRAEQMRVDFIANASHELRTPIASLQGYIETLQGPARDDPIARTQFLDIMAEQARRMARLIDDLMSLSRIELDEHMTPQDRVRVIDVLNKSRDVILPMAEPHAVAIELKVPFGVADAFVLGDEDELVQIFQNLLDNGVKYGADGGRIEILGQLDEAARSVVIRVRDFGEGIGADHLPRLTERFYRVDATMSKARGGTGLGLAIVKHIVNRHKGRLRIESTRGVGSTFEVTLPLATRDDEDEDQLEVKIVPPVRP